jgi:hypothetical protein
VSQPQRVRATHALDAMERRGILTSRQIAAGRRLLASYSLGVMGLRQEVPHASRIPAQWIEAKIAAERDYDDARDLLGGRLWPVVWAVTCNDQSVQELARERLQNPTATATLLRLGLDLLADHFRLPEEA